ncbi:MAG: ABC transporter substrate-binding protein [Actinomycetota bacterium]
MTTDLITRRDLLRLGSAGMAAILIGCSSNDADAPTTSSSVAGTPAPTTAAGSSTTTTASATPTRIIDLDSYVFDLAAIGRPPLANVYGPELLSEVLVLAPLTEEERASIADGANAAPGFVLNIEEVLALEPDLIMSSPASNAFYGEALTQLGSQVEVVTVPDDLDWRDRSRTVASLVGLDGELDERIAEADAAIAALGERVTELGLEGTEVSLLTVGFGMVNAVNPPSIGSTLLAEIGLTQPAAQLVDQPASSIFPDYAAQTALSLELLGEHDAAAAIVGNGSDPTSVTAELPEGVVIGQIPVLRDGPAIATLAFYWGLNSVIGVERMVIDLDRLLDEIGG